MALDPHVVPVAYSMVEFATKSTNPIHLYSCYWMAFNNVYIYVANQSQNKSLHVRYSKSDANGIPTKFDKTGRPTMAQVSEGEQVREAVQTLPDDVKHDLICHRNMKLFNERVPRWYGQEIKTDANGHLLNGVLKVGKTLRSDYPMWSPLDSVSYKQYLEGKHEAALRDFLALQIADLLYTVRNNLFHGGKNANEGSDIEVLENAFPLLQKVVGHYIELPKAAG